MSADATTSRFDGLKWAVVFALVAVGVVGNSYFSDQSLLYRVLGLLALAAIAGRKQGAFQRRVLLVEHGLDLERGRRLPAWLPCRQPRALRSGSWSKVRGQRSAKSSGPHARRPCRPR